MKLKLRPTTEIKQKLNLVSLCNIITLPKVSGKLENVI